MCGRVTLEFDIEMLKKILEGTLNVSGQQMHLDDYAKRYNIAPGQSLVSIINDGVLNRAGYMKWAFYPPYSKTQKEGNKIINIRSETIDTKNTFKTSFYSRRCIVLASSYYEWNTKSSTKTPYRITINDQSIIPLAGLWSSFQEASGKKTFGCSIITTQANEMVKSIHHRMPVILKNEDIATWLNFNERNYGKVKKLLRPYDFDAMSMKPVSTLINNVKYDSEDCIKPLE